MCVHVLMSCYGDTIPKELRSTMMTSFWHKYPFQTPVSMHSHTLRDLELGYQNINLEGCPVQSIANPRAKRCSPASPETCTAEAEWQPRYHIIQSSMAFCLLSTCFLRLWCVVPKACRQSPKVHLRWDSDGGTYCLCPALWWRKDEAVDPGDPPGPLGDLFNIKCNFKESP